MSPQDLSLDLEEELDLGRADHGRPTTEDEFASAHYEEPWKYELVEGRLVVLPPNGKGHVSVCCPWRDLLAVYAINHSVLVQAVVSQAWVRIDARNARIADIGVYLGGHINDLDLPRQVPELIFEFVSPSKKDSRRFSVEKRADYEKIGVREYVIIDRFARTVTVLTLVDNAYQERVLTSADTYATPLLPGFEVNLAEILPR